MANIRVGGFGATTNATKETQTLCNQVKAKAEGKTNQKYKEFKAVKYCEQVVAGKNVLIKVHVEGENYIHLSVFQALPCNGGGVELKGVQLHKTKDDPLTHF